MFPKFLSNLPGTPCKGLPKVLRMSMVNTVVLLLDLAVTATAIGFCRRKVPCTKEENPAQKGDMANENSKDGRGENTDAVWTTGVGSLLWYLESRLSQPSRQLSA